MTLRKTLGELSAVGHDGLPRSVRFPPGSKKRNLWLGRGTIGNGLPPRPYEFHLIGKYQTKNGKKVPRTR